MLSDDADPDWVEAVRGHARVFRDQRWQHALRDAERLGQGIPCARITDVPPSDALCELKRQCDPDAVCFADRATERAWQAGMLD